MPAGDYRVAAYASGYLRQYYGDGSDFSLASRVTVQSGNNAVLDFALPTQSAISGTVTELPAG